VSQENVELIVAGVAAFNTGDVEAFIDFMAPDVETLPDSSVFPEAGPLRGRDAYRTFAEGTRSAWEGSRWETSEVFETRNDCVVHRGNWVGRGAASGIEMSMSLTGVYTLQDHRIIRIEFYFDHAEALKAVGLEE
jgi:ketosteroid isomerase-like protein